VHSVISELRSNKRECIMTAISNEASRGIIKDLSMFVDSVVELGK
jgi:hypothetical protein